MTLTAKQESFAQFVADGLSQADAYRKAFDVSDSTKPETVYKRASELMDNGEIAGRVQDMRDKLAEASIWTRLDSVQTLAEIAKGYAEDAKASDRVSAVKALNAMHGWDAPTKVAQTDSAGNDVKPDATSAVLSALMRKHNKGDADT